VATLERSACCGHAHPPSFTQACGHSPYSHIHLWSRARIPPLRRRFELVATHAQLAVAPRTHPPSCTRACGHTHTQLMACHTHVSFTWRTLCTRGHPHSACCGDTHPTSFTSTWPHSHTQPVVATRTHPPLRQRFELAATHLASCGHTRIPILHSSSWPPPPPTPPVHLHTTATVAQRIDAQRLKLNPWRSTRSIP
jgi:hypothetical protein